MRYEYEKEPLTDINDVVRFLKQNPQNPYYDFDTDYTTNSSSYYDYLAKLKPLIQILAERIYDYDKELAKRFEEWDKRIETLPKELEDLLVEWLNDGTLEQIINVNIFNDLNDKIDNVNKEVNKRMEEVERTTPKIIENDIGVYVGKGGDYLTINDALEDLSRKFLPYKKDGLTVEIILLSNYVMKEQVIVSGVDLGWIVISSEKNESTVIDRDSMKINTIESRYPAFTGLDGATLPTINTHFEFSLGDKTSGFDGITVARGSKVELKPGSGVNNADRGLGAYYNSEAFCYMEGLTEGGMGLGAGSETGVVFQNCSGRAFMASYGSEIECARSQLQNCQGDHAVYIIWQSTGDLYQSNISGSKGTGIMCRDGSTCNARETDVSNCNIGYHATHAGVINARSLTESKWVGESAKNCKQYGALASYASTIELNGADVSNSLRNGIHASDGSIINANGLTGLNVADQAVSAFRNAMISVDGANVKFSKIGVLADSSSVISANSINASECIDYALLARNGSKISAQNSQIYHSKTSCHAINASTISCKGANAEGSEIGFYARFASTIDGENADARNCKLYGFYANEGSTINAVNSIADNISTIKTGTIVNQSVAYLSNRDSNINCRNSQAINCNIGCLSYEGSNVNASTCNMSNSLKNGYQVLRGSTLTAVGSVGKLSQEENTLKKEGIIYYYMPEGILEE